ncbi:hypothetical protein [Adhaeribacter aquaticus]|uniref:hypothetical protein n=1 Tax=Adhaeribacter aquaticus TaxID=299567 RepID=UPI0004098464|nr:hypothetical protein [Adhaeribacter aquaticus]
MRFFLAVLFWSIFLPTISFSQSNYKKGLVVNIQGDTLRGFIDYQEWRSDPVSVYYKKNLNDTNPIEFTNETANYFEITGLDAYQRYVGRVTMDPINMTHLSVDIDTTTSKANRFIRIVQKGERVNLLSYTDNIKTRFFIQENADVKPTELLFRQYYQTYDDVNIRKIQSSRIYKGQLWLLANNLKVVSPALKNQIESAEYAKKDFVNILNKLNGLGKQEVITGKGNTPNKARFFLGFGGNRSNLTVTGIKNQGNLKLAGKSEYSPKISTGIDLFFNRNTQRLFFRGEVSFLSSKTEITSVYNSYLTNLKVQQNTLSLSPELIYNIFNKDIFKFNIGVGGFANISEYSNIDYRKSYLTSEKEEIGTLRKNYQYFPKKTAGVLLRSGLIINKKIDLSALYYSPVLLTSDGDYEFRSQMIHLELNYFFKR